MDTSLIISATQAGKRVTKAITNINPEKENAVLKTFAQKVNALTTNIYVDATRVNKMSVEEEDPQSGGSGGGSTPVTVDTSNNLLSVVMAEGAVTLSAPNSSYEDDDVQEVISGTTLTPNLVVEIFYGVGADEIGAVTGFHFQSAWTVIQVDGNASRNATFFGQAASDKLLFINLATPDSVVIEQENGAFALPSGGGLYRLLRAD